MESGIMLPAIQGNTSELISHITEALGVPRDVLAADADILHAWTSLPRLLSEVPGQHRDQLLARMCIAVSTGLFDSAINYIWNIGIISLKEKVKNFGLHIVPQIVGKEFDERKLESSTDSDLISLCLQLNIIDEESYFYLDQCRDIRNNFSAAHPVIGDVDAYELVNFINRCIKHALLGVKNPRGVDSNAFIEALKGRRFTADQSQEWIRRLLETHEAQRNSLVQLIHGIYCDETVSEEARVNSIELINGFVERLSPTAKSGLIARHSEYKAKGDEKRIKASMQFFEKVGLLYITSDVDRHMLIASAAETLYSMHLGMNNFYNEPPFAQRLLEISRSAPIPATAQELYVETVVTCAVGNEYGQCWSAEPHYHAMIRSFTPAQIQIMLRLADSDQRVGSRIKSYKKCRTAFVELVRLIDPVSVHSSFKSLYEKWVK